MKKNLLKILSLLLICTFLCNPVIGQASAEILVPESDNIADAYVEVSEENSLDDTENISEDAIDESEEITDDEVESDDVTVDVGILEEGADGPTSSMTIPIGSDSNSNQENSLRSIYVPNVVAVTNTPYKNYFQIRVANYGSDSVDSVTVTVLLYNNVTGDFIDTFTKTLTNVKVGTTSFKFTKKVSNTVEEKVRTAVNGFDGAQAFTMNKYTLRWNFVGGAYGKMKAYGGHRHHCPAKNNLELANVSVYNGPAIRMIVADHKKTASYGNNPGAPTHRNKQKALIKAGKFDEAMQLDVDDLRDNFGNKYNKAKKQMISYAVSEGYIKSGSVK